MLARTCGLQEFDPPQLHVHSRARLRPGNHPPIWYRLVQRRENYCGVRLLGEVLPQQHISLPEAISVLGKR